MMAGAACRGWVAGPTALSWDSTTFPYGRKNRLGLCMGLAPWPHLKIESIQAFFISAFHFSHVRLFPKRKFILPNWTVQTESDSFALARSPNQRAHKVDPLPLLDRPYFLILLKTAQRNYFTFKVLGHDCDSYGYS